MYNFKRPVIQLITSLFVEMQGLEPWSRQSN